MSFLGTSVLFFCLLLLVLSGLAAAAEVDWGLGRGWPMVVHEDQVWVGTTGGLYRYDVSEDSWLMFTPREGLCGWAPELLGLDQGILWVGTSEGLCNADVHLFDWDVFDTTRGLPSNKVLSLAFQDDYVWVGTDGGVVRYDPLTEELERFSDRESPSEVRVNDIAVEGRTVWLATDEGVWEFSAEYETWRAHGQDQGLISRRVDRIITGSGNLWFLTDAGLMRLETASRTWFPYQITTVRQINDVAFDGGDIWLATGQGVFFFDPDLDHWREFQELKALGAQVVNGIVMASGYIWVATDLGVGRFDRATRTWTIYTVDNGLSSNEVKTIAFWNQILFVTSGPAIDYYKVAEDRWYTQPVTLPESEELLQRASTFSLGGPEGTVLRASSQVTMRLLGRASYQYQRRDEQVIDGESSTLEEETQGRTDLVLASRLGSERMANLFYDDTRFDQDREYGLRYRGAEADLLQEVSVGDMRWNLGRGDLLPTLGLFGGGARMEAGSRTDRLRRKRLALFLASGDQTTDFHSDFFIGASRSQGGSLEDRRYLKRRFFHLTEAGDAPIRSGSVRIYLDDGREESNTPNTLVDWSVAGISGDFDLLHPVADYVLDGVSGVVDVLASLPVETRYLVAVFEPQGEGEGKQERILYGPQDDRSLVNRYFLGAAQILPQTLHLTIRDTLGVEHPPSEFGLDADGDGAVDAQFVDFQHGILSFPQARPFPEDVYLAEDPGHLYSIHYHLKTGSVTLPLTHGDLVSETEKVVVDGLTLRRGEDYIIDYRSGSLLFLQEGVVDQSSRVEVEYEHRRPSEDRLSSLGASFSPSDVLSAAVGAARYSPKEGHSDSAEVDLVHAAGEFRLDDGLADLNLLVLSEVARSVASQLQGDAAHIRATAKSSRLRLLTEMEDYDRRFYVLRPRRTALGRLMHRSRLEAEYEQPNMFLLDAAWTMERSLDGMGQAAREERYQTRGILTRRNFPSLVVTATRSFSGGSSPFPDQTAFRGDLEYQLPGSWASAMAIHSLKVTSYVHRTWEDGIDTTYSPVSQKAIRQGEYLRLDMAPKPSLQMAGSIRRDWRKVQGTQSAGEYQLASAMEEAIFTTNCDQFPGLSLYARLEGDSREDMLSGTEGQRAYDLNRQRQVLARLFPGFWQRMLSPLTLELDYVYRWNGLLSGLRRGLDVWDRYWSVPRGEALMAAEEFQSRQIRGELRPSAVISLDVGLERQQRDVRQSWSLLGNRVWKYTSKVELRWARSVLVLSYLRDESQQMGIATQTRDTPSVWWERRWRQGLITKISLFGWREILREGKEQERAVSISPRLGITSRWPRLGVLKEVELVDDLSLSLSRRERTGNEAITRVVANSLKLDIQPLPLALIRLQSRLSYSSDGMDSDVIHHDLTLKLTLQF